MILSPKEFREEMHKIPEVAFNEYKTTQFIVDNIRKAKEKYNSSLELFRVLETGLICVHTKNPEEEYTLFRADIDALPIKEETGVEFASLNNNMHACGHDVHAAILYGTILEVMKNNIKKNLIFVFQPAEEHGGGAEKILETGFLDKYKIKNAFAYTLLMNMIWVLFHQPKVLCLHLLWNLMLVLKGLQLIVLDQIKVKML
jgi:N-acetyldiaminopimelate deacetylase